MIRILHITPSYKPATIYGGPIVSVARLCTELKLRNPSLAVMCTTANGKTELLATSLEIDEVSVNYYTRITGDHSHFSPALLKALWPALAAAEVVHIHSWWNLVAIPSVILCRLRGIKPILSPRGMLSPFTMQSWSKGLFHFLLGRWLLRGTILHATSTQEAAEALALVPGWSHFILPNMVELPNGEEFIQSTRTELASPLNLIFLSRIHPKKGLETLLKALAIVSFPWNLQIVGEGDADYTQLLQRLIEHLNIQNRVSWLGWLDGAEKFQLLAAADLFVLPSLNENFANAVIEALSVGTPVLLSDQVGLSTYVKAQDLGWVYQGSSAELAAQLQAAQADVSKRTRIRAQAPQRIQVDFGAESLSRQYLAVYNQVLKGQRSPLF